MLKTKSCNADFVFVLALFCLLPMCSQFLVRSSLKDKVEFYGGHKSQLAVDKVNKNPFGRIGKATLQ
jgi:hypothetical protein